MKNSPKLKVYTDQELIDLLTRLQLDISQQSILKIANSGYFRQHFLESQLAKEKVVIRQLRSLGIAAEYTKYSQPRLKIV